MWEGRKSIWILKTQINADFCKKKEKEKEKRDMTDISIHDKTKTLEKSNNYTKKIKWNEKYMILSQSQGLMQILNDR